MIRAIATCRSVDCHAVSKVGILRPTNITDFKDKSKDKLSRTRTWPSRPMNQNLSWRTGQGQGQQHWNLNPLRLMTDPNKLICKNCSHVCVNHCVQLWYTIWHRAVHIIFPLNLQTIITVKIMSNGGDGCLWWNYLHTIQFVIRFQLNIPSDNLVNPDPTNV